MRRALPALFLFALPAGAAEPDICYASSPPPDAVPTDHYLTGSPFTAMDQTLMALYLPRALCGEDVTRDKAFWRSFVAAFDCSPESEIARLVDGWLDDAPEAARAEFDAAKAAEPDRVARLCARVADCTVPEAFDIDGNDGFYCTSLKE